MSILTVLNLGFDALSKAVEESVSTASRCKTAVLTCGQCFKWTLTA